MSGRRGRGGGGPGGGGGRFGSGGGRMAPGLRPVEEHVRISIADQLADFQRGEAKGERGGQGREGRHASAHEGRPPFPPLNPLLSFSLSAEIKFPPGLSNHDRAVVHAECRKYGFRSKSHG